MAEIGAVLDIGGSMAQWQEKMLKGKDVGAKVQSTTLPTAASSASVDAPAPVTASALGLNPAPAFVPVSSTYSTTMGRTSHNTATACVTRKANSQWYAASGDQ